MKTLIIIYAVGYLLAFIWMYGKVRGYYTEKYAILKQSHFAFSILWSLFAALVWPFMVLFVYTQTKGYRWKL